MRLTSVHRCINLADDNKIINAIYYLTELKASIKVKDYYTISTRDCMSNLLPFIIESAEKLEDCRENSDIFQNQQKSLKDGNKAQNNTAKQTHRKSRVKCQRPKFRGKQFHGRHYRQNLSKQCWQCKRHLKSSSPWRSEGNFGNRNKRQIFPNYRSPRPPEDRLGLQKRFLSMSDTAKSVEIPSFSGENMENVEEFISKCAISHSDIINDDEKQRLSLEALVSHIKGQAKEFVESLPHQQRDNRGHLIFELLKRYSERNNTVLADIQKVIDCLNSLKQGDADFPWQKTDVHRLLFGFLSSLDRDLEGRGDKTVQPSSYMFGSRKIVTAV
jgi:hypothetical protein